MRVAHCVIYFFVLFFCIEVHANEKATFELRYIRTTIEGGKPQQYTGHGWATAIGDHQLVTCAHLINTVVEIRVGDQWVPCRVDRQDDEFDVALISATIDFEDQVKLVDDREDLSKPKILLDQKDKMKLQDAKPIGQNNIRLAYSVKGGKQGMSGRGCYNKKGEYIGMMTGVTAVGGLVVEDTAVILPTRRIIQFLKE